MKIKICFMAMLWPVLGAMAQTRPPNYRPLSIGDTVPDIEIRHLMNYPKPTVRLSDFKGKLLILDFWATWCSPCVAAFPKMDSLRKAFGDQLVILPVTDQDEKTVSSLLTNMRKVKGLQGFSVIRDTVLRQLFKHSEIPHYAWINEQGMVTAITDGDEVTRDNIKKILEHKPLNVKMKEDISRRFDSELPLLAGSNYISTDSIIDYSVITKHVDGFPSLQSFKETKRGYKVIGLNLSVFQLLQLGYSRWEPALILSNNRTIAEVKDTVKLKGPNYYGSGLGEGKAAWNLWYKTTTFCYEKIYAHHDLDKLWTEIQQDLTKSFPEFQVGIEKRKAKCLVMVRLTKDNLLNTAGGTSEHTDNKYNFHLKNAAWKLLPLKLGMYYLQLLPMPVIDETGITGNVDLDITVNMSSVPELRKALKKYGVDIIEGERDIGMIVIKDYPVVRDSKTEAIIRPNTSIP